MERRSTADKPTFTRFLWTLTTSAARHDLGSLAAVIAFYAFFSMFPLILLILYTASAIMPHTDVEGIVMQMFRPYLPALPEAKLMIEEHVSELAAVGGKVGVLSALSLAWSAMSGFIAVQQAMDVIWETEQRSFLGRRAVSFVMLVVVLTTTLGSALVTAVYPAVADLPLARSGPLAWISRLHVISRVVFPLSLFTGLVIFYRYLPSRRASWAYVAPGAVTATALLDLGREVFVWYARHLVGYQMIYGGLAAVMLLVLWIYVASIIMLVGAEFAAALERLFEGRN